MEVDTRDKQDKVMELLPDLKDIDTLFKLEELIDAFLLINLWKENLISRSLMC